MNKAQLIAAVADRLGISRKQAAKAVHAVIDSITTGVREEGKVSVTGFGTFEKVHRPASTMHNPRTGEPVDVPDRYTPRFKAGRNLKDAIRN